ncbi:MAG: hypothetical protein KatS3mg060_2091 [Dehalococcoidia bacterium]|nr:MAG: hypothetical protein KatS3mg060_2091 [Dehalococcoidia bacterium]
MRSWRAESTPRPSLLPNRRLLSSTRVSTSWPVPDRSPRGPLVVRASLSLSTRNALASALLRIHDADPDAAQVLNVGAGRRFTQSTGGAPPTLRRVATLAGVSYATVSRVVNGARDVAPATAARVRAIIEELGYRPNGNALVLRGERAPIVGFLIPAEPDPLSLRLAHAIRRRLDEAGIPLVLCPLDGPVAESAFLDLLFDGRLGALVCPPPLHDDPGLQEAIRTERIVLAVGDSATTSPTLVRTVDDAVQVLTDRLRSAKALAIAAPAAASRRRSRAHAATR